MHDGSTHDGAVQSAPRGSLTAWGIGSAALVLLVAAGVAWAVLPRGAYVEHAPQKTQVIRPLGLETEVLHYRVPDDRKLAIWIEVYCEGRLVEAASPAVTWFPDSGGQGEIRISRFDLRELGGEDDRLKIGLEVADASGRESWTHRHVDWPEPDLSTTIERTGRVKLSDDDPRILWVAAYTALGVFTPAVLPHAPERDAELAERASLALIVRARLLPRPEDDMPRSGAKPARALMGEQLLQRMPVAQERETDDPDVE